eukprot:8521184-Prorocentrum_lima.AAC.1
MRRVGVVPPDLWRGLMVPAGRGLGERAPFLLQSAVQGRPVQTGEGAADIHCQRHTAGTLFEFSCDGRVRRRHPIRGPSSKLVWSRALQRLGQE